MFEVHKIVEWKINYLLNLWVLDDEDEEELERKLRAEKEGELDKSGILLAADLSTLLMNEVDPLGWMICCSLLALLVSETAGEEDDETPTPLFESESEPFVVDDAETSEFKLGKFFSMNWLILCETPFLR